MKVLALCSALALSLTGFAGAQAAIITANGNDGGSGSLIAGVPVGNEVSAVKLYTAVGPMALTIVVDAPGTYTLDETIINATADDWDQFDWLLLGPVGTELSDLVGGLLGGGTTLTTFGAAGATASASGGLVPTGGTFESTLEFIVDASLFLQGAQDVTMLVVQVPNVAAPTRETPEPASLALFAFGALGVLAVRRRTRTSP